MEPISGDFNFGAMTARLSRIFPSIRYAFDFIKLALVLSLYQEIQNSILFINWAGVSGKGVRNIVGSLDSWCTSLLSEFSVAKTTGVVSKSGWSLRYVSSLANWVIFGATMARMLFGYCIIRGASCFIFVKDFLYETPRLESLSTISGDRASSDWFMTNKAIWFVLLLCCTDIFPSMKHSRQFLIIQILIFDTPSHLLCYHDLPFRTSLTVGPGEYKRFPIFWMLQKMWRNRWMYC